MSIVKGRWGHENKSTQIFFLFIYIILASHSIILPETTPPATTQSLMDTIRTNLGYAYESLKNYMSPTTAANSSISPNNYLQYAQNIVTGTAIIGLGFGLYQAYRIHSSQQKQAREIQEKKEL